MKHLLVINPNSDTFSNPTLISIFDELTKDDEVKLTILSPKQKIEIPSKYKRIYELQLDENSVNWTKKINTWFPKINSILKLKNYCKLHQIDDVICIDPIGLIIGGRIKRLLNQISLHYISFEIFFSDELLDKSYYYKIKKKEIFYSKHIESLLIQDEHRLKLLVKENKIDLKNIRQFLIPVSPNYGLVSGNNKKTWREKLGISEHKIVLLHSGSLDKWSGADMLIQSLQNELPENLLILIHSKTELDSNNSFHCKLLEIEKKNKSLLIHRTVFSDFNEYLSFLQIADFGLVLYQKDLNSPYTGKNIEEIGLASGKFACFLSQGLPIISTNSVFYDKLNKKYDFGYFSSSLDEIFNEIQKLKSEIVFKKSENSKHLFAEVLNVEISIKKYCSQF